jgi:site-specific DNA-methyltransferase (adenine-specific)
MRDRVLELTRCRAGDLRANPANYRTHPKAQREALRGVLEEIGYAAALIARRGEDGSLTLIDGHLRADLDPGQVVPVLVLDVTEEEAEKLLASMDPIAALARPDPEALLALLGRVGTASEPLADLFERMRHSAEADLPGRLRDPDQIPSSSKARARAGDCYVLGAHRLVVGDATSKADMATLMAGEKADLYVTDPPYGVSYTGRTRRALRIRNDSREGLQELLAGSFARADEVVRPGAPLYVFHSSGELSIIFAQAVLAQGWSFRQTLIWKKDRPVIGHGDYMYAHEPIIAGYTASPKRRGRGSGGFYGGNDQSSVIEVPRPAASASHPTMKPTELLRRLIANSSRQGQIVLDSFGGSGSTLAACEDLGRRAFLMEIDPAYGDVILARFEALTAKKAELEERVG